MAVMHRKGVFFTLMTLLIIALFFTYMKINQAPVAQLADARAANTRITVMNTYIDTFESQAQSGLATAGYFTLQNLSARVRTGGAYITNMNASIVFCMNNNTNPYNCLTKNATINTSLYNLEELARTNLSITTSYNVENVWVTEERPFEVVFWMNLSYTISDPWASWTIANKTLRADVDVAGIEDPAFAFANATNLSHTRFFSETPLARFQFSNTTFTQYYWNESYTANPGSNQNSTQFAPSVLQRYAGNLLNGSSCCGIESVMIVQNINSTTLSDPRLVNASFVDYLFFSRQNAVFNCNLNQNAKFKIGSFPDTAFFRMDTYHFFNVYNVSTYANYTCS